MTFSRRLLLQPRGPSGGIITLTRAQRATCNRRILLAPLQFSDEGEGMLSNLISNRHVPAISVVYEAVMDTCYLESLRHINSLLNWNRAIIIRMHVRIGFVEGRIWWIGDAMLRSSYVSPSTGVHRSPHDSVFKSYGPAALITARTSLRAFSQPPTRS